MEKFIKKYYDFGQLIVVAILATILLYAGYILNGNIPANYDSFGDFAMNEIIFTNSYIVGGVILLLLALIGLLYLLVFKSNTSFIVDVVDGLLYGMYLIFTGFEIYGMALEDTSFVYILIYVVGFLLLITASLYWIKSFEMTDNRIKDAKTNRIIYLVIVLGMTFGAAFGAYNILFNGLSSEDGYAYVQAYNLLLPLIVIAMAKFTYNYQLSLQADYLDLGKKISEGKIAANKKLAEVEKKVEKVEKKAAKDTKKVAKVATAVAAKKAVKKATTKKTSK